MAIKIFEDKIRTDNDPCKYSEGSFEFYDRSGWPAAKNVRQLLNQWLSDFPDEGQKNLSQRFRSEFEASFFELLCYTIFKRLGFTLDEHPEMSHTTKRCDFGVHDANRFFYMECISTNGLSKENEAKQNLENFFYDLLDNMDCPNFYFRLKEVTFNGSRTPAFSKVRKELQKLVDEISPDSVAIAQIRDFSDLPAFLHKDENFKLQLSLVPKGVERRSSKTRNIGVSTTKFHTGGFGHVLNGAIKRKAANYGKIGAPLLLAINALTELPIDDYDIEDALYDHYTAYLPRILAGTMSCPDKAQKAFLTKTGFSHTRVSAVLFTRATPTNLSTVPYWIYYHPKATNPLLLEDIPLNRHQITESGIMLIKGNSICELLGMPSDWPGEKVV